MCGIVGCVNTGSETRATVERMARTLAHRGPDDEGFFVDGAGAVALGHRRLSIIDLAGGHQPMSIDDGAIHIVFNGEIYNYRELRETLRRLGRRFDTESDTETILHAYAAFGDACVERLNGMFAFALFDRPRGRLLLARDRFGKKPLHYTHSGKRLVFASEIKGVLAHPDVGRELDQESFARYLELEYVPSPRTIFRGVLKLPPAHTMSFDVATGEAALRRYWTLACTPKRELSHDEAADELHRRLREAVRLRLISDVPLGVFLSGGIDSSAVVALASELGGRVRTFNVAFQEKSYDESEHARAVARHFGTEHHEEVFSLDRMRDAVHDVMPLLDEPFADASVLPTYLLCRHTREYVTVALGGDGSDELLAGYPTFPASRFADSFRHLPRGMIRALQRAVEHLPASTANFSADFKLRQFLRGAVESEPARTHAWLGAFVPSEIDELLAPDARAAALSARAHAAHALAGEGSWLDRLVSHYVDTYLVDDILVKVDRASMATSLEVRSPFLDVHVVELLARLPDSHRLVGWHGKQVLRRAFSRLLPDGIAARGKKGFGIPIAGWLKRDLAVLVDEKLGHDRLTRRGLVRPDIVSRLIREHRSGRRNHRKRLWTLLAFELWADHHL